MLSHALSLILATTTFACPFLCGEAISFVARDDAEATCKCCCSHNVPKQSDETPDEDCGESCQCVCGGAVVDHAASHIDGCDLSALSMQIVIDVHASSQTSARMIAERAKREPLDGMNCGRAMRCLFESYLC
jgi:hypothetical protein